MYMHVYAQKDRYTRAHSPTPSRKTHERTHTYMNKHTFLAKQKQSRGLGQGAWVANIRAWVWPTIGDHSCPPSQHIQSADDDACGMFWSLAAKRAARLVVGDQTSRTYHRSAIKRAKATTCAVTLLSFFFK